jgi:hypothetical protein
METKLTWIQERLALDHMCLSKLVKRLPAILSYSIGYNLEPKFVWLGERLALDDVSLGVVLQQLPSLFNLNIEMDLESTIKLYKECVGSDAGRTCITIETQHYVTPAWRIGSSQDWQKPKRVVLLPTQELFSGLLNVHNLHGQKV